MTRRTLWVAALAASAASASLAISSDARACGGCFAVSVGSKTESTVVTGHRMALSVSTARTILWDQIQYSGDPSEFAWVLPVRAGATIELSTDAWFEALDASTTVRVVSPTLTCPSPPPTTGCGSQSSALFGGFDSAGAGSSPSPVTVLHEGSVGPYETVTLETKVPGVLDGWLGDHGYPVPAGMQPVIDAYVQEGFDFIALRLLPGKGVRQMKPVRVVSPGASPVLPLRMVAAGTGAQVAITLFVIGEGRWETSNFPNGLVPKGELSWDFAASASNYATLRQSALAANGGLTWLTAFAQLGALLRPITDTTQPYYYYGGDYAPTIAKTYFDQAAKNGETSGATCAAASGQATAAATNLDIVQPSCPAEGCPPGAFDASTLACGAADDLGAALVGMHPADVWLTRLEANLPHAALANDLVLQASLQQSGVPNALSPSILTGQQEECRILSDKAAAKFSAPPSAGAAALGLAALAALLRRALRATRRSRSAPGNKD